MDFTRIAPGLNRNFDLHRLFRERLERAPIRSTAVLNGAFMNLLSAEAPLVLFKIKRVLYWGENPYQLIDIVTMDDTAAYTAEAALSKGEFKHNDEIQNGIELAFIFEGSEKM